MYILKKVCCVYLFIGFLFCFQSPHIIAVMVEFQSDNSGLTSGDGQFLDSSYNIDMLWDTTLTRCDQFIVDRPPHDSTYFSSQIKAVSNYFESASNNEVNIKGHIVMNSDPEAEKGYYKLSKDMESYSYSDKDLSILFKESLELSKDDIEQHLEEHPEINFDDVIFTVFHAGIGQDFSFPTFDPTVYDLKSAYIEDSMFEDIEYPVINNIAISSGILLPETQNMIFFNSIEDIFYGEQSYCDYQLGMVGTFSFLMGYALELPPLFNTETGDPGIGIFGLMDYGSNNGRGIIPALPSPWTRILKNWQSPFGINNTTPQEFVINNIYMTNISENEYFLFENKLNKLFDGLSLSDVISNYNGQFYDDSLNSSSNWFDALISKNETYSIFEFSEDSVITSVLNYDLGLPGSGILIWHINESIIDAYDGINNNPNNKAVSIEEADGALDIGFTNYFPFANFDPTVGTRWDFWYIDNEAYHDYSTNSVPYQCFNSENYELLNYTIPSSCIDNGGVWIRPIVFDHHSNPNSNLSDGEKSFFSFEVLDSISSSTLVKASFSIPIPNYDIGYNFPILGTADEAVFYANPNGQISTLNLSDEISDLYDFENEPYTENSVILTNSDGIPALHEISSEFAYLDPQNNDSLVELEHKVWFGYFFETNIFNQIIYNDENKQFVIDDSVIINPEYFPSSGISIGDIDADGLDEIIFVDNNNGSIVAYNPNGALVNGFPIGKDYNANVLILREQDTNSIVLVCQNQAHIDFIWLNGDIMSVPSMNQGADIFIIDNYLTDGVRFYDLGSLESSFKVGENSYWLQRYNNHSHYPLSSGIHELPSDSYSDSMISNFYNYPNPIKNGKTKFRFFVNIETDDIDINIYNISGKLIDKLTKNNIVINEYNEIEWNTQNLFPGLYFAEILSSNQQQAIIKVVVGH